MDQRVAVNVIELAAAIRKDIEALTDDDEVIRDTLEGEVNLESVLDFLLSRIGFDEAMIDTLGKQSKQISERVGRLKRRVETQRALVKKALELSGWGRCERPLATINLSPKQACLGDIDEAKVPLRFWKQPDPVLDRAALLVALNNNEDIPGAKLAPNDVVLHIRRG